MNNKVGYSKQSVKFSKTNVYILDVSGGPKGRFGLKLEAGMRARGPKSSKKFGRGRKNEGPRPFFGALWAPIDRAGQGLSHHGTLWASFWGLQALCFVFFSEKA